MTDVATREEIPVVLIEALNNEKPYKVFTYSGQKWQIDVVYVLEDGRRVETHERHSLLRDAKKEQGSLPKTPWGNLRVKLNEDGTIYMTTVTIDPARLMASLAPKPKVGPKYEVIDGEVSSTFQHRPAYRYVRKTDELPVDVDPDLSAEQIMVKVKMFNPTGSGTWWLASYDPETGVAFGAAEITDFELGSFDVHELAEFRGLGGLPVERDIHWSVRTLAEVMAERG